MAIWEVPAEWKKANVSSVFENGRKEDLGNCRLISLTYVPGKVVEHVILETILKM